MSEIWPEQPELYSNTPYGFLTDEAAGVYNNQVDGNQDGSPTK